MKLKHRVFANIINLICIISLCLISLVDVKQNMLGILQFIAVIFIGIIALICTAATE